MERMLVWTSLVVLSAIATPICMAQTAGSSTERQDQPAILSQQDLVRVSRECSELANLSNQAETRPVFESKQQLARSIVTTLGPVVKSTSGIKGRCVVVPGARACEIAPSIYIEFARPGPQFFEGDKLDFEFMGPTRISESKFLWSSGSAMFCSITFHPTSPRFTLVK